MVKRAHGVAERKLRIQMMTITFLACPVEERERGARGLQIARYLNVEEKIRIFPGKEKQSIEEKKYIRAVVNFSHGERKLFIFEEKRRS